MTSIQTANDNIVFITNECIKQELGKAQCAYVLATTEHETANTFQPLREYGLGKGRPYGIPDKRTGQVYYGRGFPQLTWYDNYAKYNKILGLVGTNDDLLKNPDVVMRLPVSTFILVHGMREGIFTGKRLGNYITVDNSKIDFVNARRIVNGMDKAHHIANIANKWLKGEHLQRFYQ